MVPLWPLKQSGVLVCSLAGSLNLRNTGVKRGRLLLAFAGAQLAFEVGISLQLVLHVVKESL